MAKRQNKSPTAISSPSAKRNKRTASGRFEKPSTAAADAEDEQKDQRNDNDIKEEQEDVKDEDGDDNLVQREEETYSEFVIRKRKRNQDKLESLGLLGLVVQEKATRVRLSAQSRLLKKRSKPKVEPRTSSRIKGEKADEEYYVINDSGGHSIQTSKMTIHTSSDGGKVTTEQRVKWYGGRVNEGEPFGVFEGIKALVDEVDRVEETSDINKTLDDLRLSAPSSSSSSSKSKSKSKSQPSSSVQSLTEFWKKTSADDDSNALNVKVVKERIYSITVSPSTSRLIVAAGDKVGNVGLWNTSHSHSNTTDDDDSSVVSFKPHNGAVSNLQFHSSNSYLLSASYDGTCRTLDLESETFLQTFAVFDSDSAHSEKPGFGIDDSSSSFYMQFACYDPRPSSGSSSLFASSSIGHAFHYDSRSNSLTFNEFLSDKKINTLDLHPDGNLLATCGLDRSTNIFDIRKLGIAKKNAKTLNPLVSFPSSKSVNSAFFSPSGDHLLTTNMADTLTIYDRSQFSAIKATTSTVKPVVSVPHNNQTGRWLTTFHSKWHPTLDVFCAGSMAQPRQMQMFGVDGKELRGGGEGHKGGVRGENLTSVVSRLAFHPFLDIVVGGNSSGRCTVLR
jgi:WD40 repeat protein